MIDNIFNKDIQKQFEFDSEVADVFDDMIDRSVPFYPNEAKLIANKYSDNKVIKIEDEDVVLLDS